ncbi:MAG TPA: serine hydrolase domain-containing protein [Verrucomicrobiae bacterium]|nr:serine hydrolase domain-containing protein [Verrucomicrobiae bacterium]
MSVPPSQPSVPEFPPDDEVRQLLQSHVDQKLAIGVIAGLLDARGLRFVSAGTSGNSARPKIDEFTLFEIGSITKIFTATALAAAAARGNLSLADPICKFLPLSENGIGNRTLKEFVTHTSGLPRLPSGFAWWWNLLRHPRDPYADYSRRDLYAYLNSLNAGRLRRGKFLYSNVSAGLLGDALAAFENTDYPNLIARHVTTPLHLERTYLNIPSSEESFVAQPHNKFLRPTNLWTMTALPGAGSLRSCMQDMLTLASAALTSAAPFAASMFQPLAPAGGPDRNVGFGWMLRHSASYQVAWHNGGTGGSRSLLGLELQTRRAIVILSNTSHSVDQLAIRLLLGDSLAAHF